MRKLLKNKAVVSGLAIVAAIAVAGNFVSVPKLLGISASARHVEAAPAEAANPAFQLPPVSRLSTEQKQWRELFPLNLNVRDPFAPTGDSPPPPPVASSALVTNAPALLPTFDLKAISYQAGRGFAVINQRVVAEGETIQGYTVERILPASVQMRGLLGTVQLTLQRTVARQKSPIAMPAPADLPAAAPGIPPAGATR